MTAAKRPVPISSHPAFKWGVGAWFALLLGLGLFVMPSTVHQLIGARLGLDGMLSGAALRAALSGAAALLGLLIGLVLAMRVASLNEVVAEDAGPEAEEDLGDVWLHDEDDRGDEPAGGAEDLPRRPFNPREDMEEEGIDAPFPGDAFEDEAEAGVTGSAFEAEPDNDSALMELWRAEMGDEADESPVAPPIQAEPAIPPAPVDAEFAGFEEDGTANLPDIDDRDEVETQPTVDEQDEDDWFDVSAPAASRDEPGYDALADFVSDQADDHEAQAAEAGFELEPPPTEVAAETDSLPEMAEPETQQSEPAPNAATALGDLSLDALTERLGTALEAFKAGPAVHQEADPVIAFLRREAERDAPQAQRFETGEDPQAELRSALDKLSRVGTPK